MRSGNDSWQACTDDGCGDLQTEGRLDSLFSGSSSDSMTFDDDCCLHQFPTKTSMKPMVDEANGEDPRLTGLSDFEKLFLQQKRRKSVARSSSKPYKFDPYA
ncbi:hypothetical protein JW711_02535 [Candidatus Woesearchaeota archaeon]|nr:hypothetical protein [Candidatus Woesearchaeota archaeon]